MGRTIAGTVRKGVVVPTVLLPEGMRVEIFLPEERSGEESKGLQVANDVCDHAAAEALRLLDHLLDEGIRYVEG